jgi:hypothetical protein
LILLVANDILASFKIKGEGLNVPYEARQASKYGITKILIPNKINLRGINTYSTLKIF